MIRRNEDPSAVDAPSPTGEGPGPSGDPWGRGFRTRLDGYSGPLELLLYLIHKNEIDILDIPISRILEQFLEHLAEAQAADSIDLQSIGDYLVMAARLLEIKSRLVAPFPSTEGEEDLLEEELEDPRRSLVEQLLDYRKVKERAQLLELAHRQRSLSYERLQHDVPPPEPGALDLESTSLPDLHAAFQRVVDLLRVRAAVEVVPGEDIPLEVAMTWLLEKLRATDSGRLDFNDLFPHDKGMAGLISTFIAILELTRLRQLRLVQESIEAPIEVCLRQEE